MTSSLSTHSLKALRLAGVKLDSFCEDERLDRTLKDDVYHGTAQTRDS